MSAERRSDGRRHSTEHHSHVSAFLLTQSGALLDALFERLWKFVKRRSVYGRYHPSFADFKAAIEQTLDQVSNTHAEDLASLLTLNFQQFENVSLMAA